MIYVIAIAHIHRTLYSHAAQSQNVAAIVERIRTLIVSPLDRLAEGG